ncbi:MAG: biosynthetic-type acetolactate synthase large subunit [Eubacteriales bacterium]|nr:biosynthetic-type acetolactate synthase large subunit [Eubacteriales bacterium]MDY4212984.1 biosynthetic-type acetolactate synthase large subunit [Eubacteriales bacterium]
MKLTGADIVIECMLEQGVDTVFGYPGGSILNIYDSLYRYSDRITHILTSHEQGAAHAADGYARTSGKVGVVFATSGPGATNLVTGIATAMMDSVPIVAITCNVTTDLLGKDSFQEIDIVGVTTPITKHNFLVKSAEDIAPTIRRAFKIARSGRPGPVLVDITKDATGNMCEFEPEIQDTSVERKIESDENAFKAAIELIESAKRPLIYAGGGVIAAEAAEELKRFRAKIDSPVTLSLMGLGAFPASDKAFTGMIGMHGTKTTSLAISECDLLIAVGARFSDRVTCNIQTFAPNAKVLHIDTDRAEIDKNVKTDHSIIGDAKLVLERLAKTIKQQHHDEWMNKIYEWEGEYPIHKPYDGVFTPQCIMETVNAAIGRDSIATTDVGQHQMWAAQYLMVERPRKFITSGGLGTMGFGLGAAIGAQVANPDYVVVNITGDGCFHMNMQELATAAKYDLPVIDVIINNNVLGMVRQWQNLFYDKRFSNTTLDKKTDYELVAKGMGANAFTATNKEELEKAMAAAVADRKTPSVINCIIDSDDFVLPMVPAGKSISDPILNIENK